MDQSARADVSLTEGSFVMRTRAMLGIGASCLLAACAHQGDGGGIAGMAWSLHHTETEGAKLAYGQPASDNVVLMLSCRPQSGRVLVALAAPAGTTPNAIELKSRRQSTRLPGAAAPGLGEGAIVEAEATVADPALRSFARTGDIAIVERGQPAKLPAGRAEKVAVADFFAQCRPA